MFWAQNKSILANIFTTIERNVTFIPVCNYCQIFFQSKFLKELILKEEYEWLLNIAITLTVSLLDLKLVHL